MTDQSALYIPVEQVTKDCMIKHANYIMHPSLMHEGAIAPELKLILTPDVLSQLYCYFTTVQKEFQAMGFVDQNEHIFTVTELVIPKHSATAVSAEIDTNSFPAFLDELEKAGKDIEKLRLQIHSHGAGSAFFSPDDVETITNEYVCSWMISIVGNTDFECKARLDIFAPIPISITLPIFVALPISPERKETWMRALLVNL